MPEISQEGFTKIINKSHQIGAFLFSETLFGFTDSWIIQNIQTLF
jgi:hypothetical protein